MKPSLDVSVFLCLSLFIQVVLKQVGQKRDSAGERHGNYEHGIHELEDRRISDLAAPRPILAHTNFKNKKRTSCHFR